MNSPHQQPFGALGLPPHERGRADLYAVIGRLLLSPDAALLARLAEPSVVPAAQPAHALGAALWALSGSARQLGAQAVAKEFDALFVSTGMPLLNPYESFYLTGFMMEKPLAALRSELAALGLGRVAGARELEDHLGAVCETMALLIAGGESLARQQADRVAVPPGVKSRSPEQVNQRCAPRRCCWRPC